MLPFFSRLTTVLCLATNLTLTQAAASAPTAASALPEVSLPGTELRQLSFQGRSYPIWVDLPPSYHSSRHDFPLLLVTDAPYAFPLIRSIRNRVGQSGQNMADFILVGLAYPAGEKPAHSRSRDYTTSDVLARPQRPGEHYSAPVYGNGPAIAGFIVRQLLPLLQQKYRIDRQRQIYLGHSYGALLGSHLLLHRPSAFSHYVLSSPSLWFDGRQLLKAAPTLLAQQAAATQAQVYLYVGGFEQPGDGPRHTSTDMVADMRQFAKVLQQAPAWQIRQQVIAGEDHLTVFPAMVTDALLKILPGHGPYTGG